MGDNAKHLQYMYYSGDHDNIEEDEDQVLVNMKGRARSPSNLSEDKDLVEKSNNTPDLNNL